MSGLVPYIIPTGGAISLSVTPSGSGMVLSRSSTGSGGTFTQLYSGVPIATYIDVGDQLVTPLASGTSYTYRLDDANGAFLTSAIQPVCQLNLQLEPLLAMLLKLLQAGLMNLTPPSGITPLAAQQVLAAMPLTGFPTMPIVSVNLDRLAQTLVPIGQNAEVVDNQTGIWTITTYVQRDFRVSVFANNTKDRDFYRDAVTGIFVAIMKSVFEPIGQNVSHKFQVVSGQVAEDPKGQAPGFYYADSHCIMDGNFNITITPNYGLISEVDVTAQMSGATLTVSAS